MAAQPYALATVEPHTRAIAEHVYTETQKQLIKSACMAAQATDDEFRLFLEVARQTGLNPLVRQIYAIHRKSGRDDRGGDRYQMTIQTGIDGYRLLAARTGALAGIDDPTYDTEEGEHPGRASVTVWRLVGGMRCPFSASARWGEYAQHFDKDGKRTYTGQWGKMPWLMLGKCAEALALRRAFPAELSGIYTDTEMDQADNSQAAPASPAQQPPARTVNAARPVARPVTTSSTDARFEALHLRAVKAIERAGGALTVEAWEDICQEIAGAVKPEAMSTDGKRALAAYVAQMETQASEGGAGAFPEEPAVDVNDLRKLGTGHGP